MHFSSYSQENRQARLFDPYPETKEIEKLKQYFKEKITNGSDSIINDLSKRTRENIFLIIGKLIEKMREDNEKGEEQFNYIPSGIKIRGRDPNPTLTEIFDREKRDYETHPEKLLKDLDLYSDYYGTRQNGVNNKGINTLERNQLFLEAIQITLNNIRSHPLHGKPAIFEFGLTKKGIVQYIGEKSIRGIEYSEIVYRIQQTYDELCL